MKINAVLVLIMLVFCLNTAIADLTDDVSQALYFRSSAYTEHNPKFGEFKQAMAQRDHAQAREIRSDRLKNGWMNTVYAENDEYRIMLRDVQGITRGSSTVFDVFWTFNDPVIISDRALPWNNAPWRFNEQILLGVYSNPRKIESIVGGSSTYTVVSLPRFAVDLDSMATLNKFTGLVDYNHNYLTPGTVPKYWLLQN